MHSTSRALVNLSGMFSLLPFESVHPCKCVPFSCTKDNFQYPLFSFLLTMHLEIIPDQLKDHVFLLLCAFTHLAQPGLSHSSLFCYSIEHQNKRITHRSLHTSWRMCRGPVLTYSITRSQRGTLVLLPRGGGDPIALSPARLGSTWAPRISPAETGP